MGVAAVSGNKCLTRSSGLSFTPSSSMRYGGIIAWCYVARRWATTSSRPRVTRTRTWTEYEAAIRCMRWEFPDRIRELGDPHNSFRSTDLVDGSAFVRRALASFPAARRLHRAIGAVVGVPRVARARVAGVPAYFQRVSPGTRWFIYEESALGARGCQIEIEVDDETAGDLSWCLLRRRFVVTLLGALRPVGLHIPIAYVETSEEEYSQSDHVPPVVGGHQGDAGG